MTLSRETVAIFASTLLIVAVALLLGHGVWHAPPQPFPIALASDPADPEEPAEDDSPSPYCLEEFDAVDEAQQDFDTIHGELERSSGDVSVMEQEIQNMRDRLAEVNAALTRAETELAAATQAETRARAELTAARQSLGAARTAQARDRARIQVQLKELALEVASLRRENAEDNRNAVKADRDQLQEDLNRRQDELREQRTYVDGMERALIIAQRLLTEAEQALDHCLNPPIIAAGTAPVRSLYAAAPNAAAGIGASMLNALTSVLQPLVTAINTLLAPLDRLVP